MTQHACEKAFGNKNHFVGVTKECFFYSPLFCLCSEAQQPAETFPVNSASVKHSDMRKGEVFKFIFDQSKIFPGASREVSVYVPGTRAE
jgi:hypothetical protein